MPQSDEPRVLPPEGEGAHRSIAQHPPNACGRPWSIPSARGTGRLQPRIASAANNTAAIVEPASRRGCVVATTPGAEDATTVRRIRAPRPNRSVSLQPGHTTGAVPGPVPSPDHHHQVLRGDKAKVVACGLPASVPAERDGRRQPHHPQPPPFPLRRCPGMAGASASCADL
jgi:hypothetical protein